MAVKIRRSYKGAATSAVLDSSGVSSATQTSISLTTSPANWPTGKFFIVVAPGTAQEEKMCVTLSGSTLTVVSPSTASTSASDTGRGADDTTARSLIAGGATVYPVFTATDANEANELTSTYANQGGMVYQGASTFTQLGIGTAGQVLKVNSGATAPEWGQVAEAGIADNAVTNAKMADNSVGAAEIINSSVGIDELATAVINKLVPVGTIAMYGGASAPTGWLLCNGDAINGSYTALIAIVGANTPDLKGRFAIGDNASLTLLGTGGSTTIAEANLPSHSHGSGTLSTSTAGSHSHSGGTGYAGIHQHDYYKTTVTQRAVFNADLDTTDDVVSTYSLDETSIPNEGDGTHFHSIGADGNHSHSVNSGSTGTAGSGTAYYPPYLVVNYIIKHD